MERLSSSAHECSIDYSIAVIFCLRKQSKHVEVTSRNCDCQRFTGIPVISEGYSRGRNIDLLGINEYSSFSQKGTTAHSNNFIKH